MNEHRPPEGVDQILSSIRQDLRSLEAAVGKLEQLSSKSKERTADVYFEVHRIADLSERLTANFAAIQGHDQLNTLQSQMGEMWVRIDAVIKTYGINFNELLAQAQQVEFPQDEPPQDEQAFLELKPQQTEDENDEEFADKLKENIQRITRRILDLTTTLQSRSETGNLDDDDLKLINSALEDFIGLDAVLEELAFQFPNRSNLINSLRASAERATRLARARLERFRDEILQGQQTKKETRRTPDANWPPQTFIGIEESLNVEEPILSTLESKIKGTLPFKPGVASDDQLYGEGKTYIDRINLVDAGVRGDVNRLATLITIVLNDVAVDVDERFAREKQVQLLKTRLETYIGKTDEIRLLFWKRSILHQIPEAADVQKNIDSYTTPNPAVKDMAGYTLFRKGVVDLVGQIEKLRAKLPALSGGDSEKITYVENWLANFDAVIVLRRTEAFAFWKANLKTIYPSLFDETVPGSLAQHFRDAMAANINAATTPVGDLWSDLSSARKKAEADIVIDQRSGVIPPDTEESQYTEHLKSTWWDRADIRIKELSDVVDVRGEKEKIKSIQRLLENIKKHKFIITIDDNQVEKAYDNIKQKFSDIIETSPLITQAEKDALHLEIVHGEYMHTRRAYDDVMRTVETRDLGVSLALEQFGKVVEARILPPMDQLAQTMESLRDPAAAQYRADYELAKKDCGKRKSLHISWEQVWPSIIGNSAESGRLPPTKLNHDNFPFEGAVIEDLIAEGILGMEFGSSVNGDNLSTLRVVEEPHDALGTVQVRNIRQTLFGYCMRIFDDLYSGRLEIPDPQHGKITSRNIHTTFESMIHYAYEKAAEEYRRDKRLRPTDEIPFDQHSVLLAWRLHSISTTNLSALAKDSPTMPDNLYYLYNWIDYCVKYAGDQTNGFDVMQTLFVAGYPNSDVLRIIYTPSQLEEVKDKLRDKGWFGENRNGHIDSKTAEESKKLWQKEAIQSFRPMVEPPFIRVEHSGHKILKDDAGNLLRRNGKFVYGADIEGESTPAPLFAPPLRWFLVRDEQPDGSYRVRKHSGENGGDGRPVRFDDLQTVDGQRLYEEMPFHQLGKEYMEYYNHLGKDAMWMLTEIFKTRSEDFLKKMDSPDFVKTLRNQAKYAGPMFDRIAPKSKDSRTYEGIKKSVGETVYNTITSQLVLAKCIMETNVLKPTFWTIKQVDDYLQRLASADALSVDVTEAIKLIVIDGRKTQMRMMTFLQRLQKQIEDASVRK